VKGFKVLIGAATAAACLGAGGAAQAASFQQLIDTLGSTDFRLEDDSLEFQLVDSNGNGRLDVGDTLRGIAEFSTFESNDGNTTEILINNLGNNHLSALFEARVVAKVPTATPGEFNFFFGPAGTLNNPGTMIEIYEDTVDNLTIFNCGGSVAACEASVTDGVLVHELGMLGIPAEFWIALEAPDDTSAGQGFPSTANLGDFNFRLSTIATSLELPNSSDPFLTLWRGSGSIQGINDKPNVNGYYDFVDDAQLGPTSVPEPSTLGLLGVGLAAIGLFGVVRRRGRLSV
jgi:hypothetical protein